MPELPEVETMRRGIESVAGCRIARVRRPRCRLRPITISPALPTLRRRVQDRVIQSVGRLGKRVVLDIEPNQKLVFEPRMTGLVLLAEPPNREHLRLQFELVGDGPPQLAFWDRRGLGSVRLWQAAEFRAAFESGRLGPDALEISKETLRQRLSLSRRAIKVALLDQRTVAGIGNLYAAEILHAARIHPERPCCELTAAQWKRLHEATIAILTEAIRYEGSTLSDGTYRNALNAEGGYQNHHRVYARAGQDCPRCAHGVVQRIVQAQRATFYCPRCQK